MMIVTFEIRNNLLFLDILLEFRHHNLLIIVIVNIWMMKWCYIIKELIIVIVTVLGLLLWNNDSWLLLNIIGGRRWDYEYAISWFSLSVQIYWCGLVFYKSWILHSSSLLFHSEPTTFFILYINYIIGLRSNLSNFWQIIFLKIKH
jgi:hypothetical protein